MKSPEERSPSRIAVLIALAIGAAGSEYLMFRVGRRNPSALLMAMFAAWVLAPFAALAWCHAVAARWRETFQTVLNATSLLVAVTSLVVYGYIALGPARPQPAFFFLVLPFCSLVLTAALVLFSKREKGLTSRNEKA